MSKLSTAAGATKTPEPAYDTSSEVLSGTDDTGEVGFTETGVDFSDDIADFNPMTYEQVVSQLAEPLDRDVVKQRQGAYNSMLDYLEWTTVVKQLNAIFGYGHWTTEVTNLSDMAMDDSGIPMGVRATVKLSVAFPSTLNHYGPLAVYENVGFHAVQPFKNGNRTWESYEVSVKSAVHDALKRCAVNLGNQFGLSLYEKESRTSGTTTTAQTRTPAATGTTSGGQSEQDVDGGYFCEACGKAITGYTAKSSGKTYTAQQLANFSKNDCDGHIFCYDHKAQYVSEHGGRH